MILKITNSEEIYGLDVYKISLKNFGLKQFHPYIASQHWDLVEVDLCEETPRGYLKQLLPTTRIVPIFNKDDVTVRVMQLLCEIAPDFAAKLRVSYIKDKTEFNKLLDEVAEFYKW